ncbi:hypothetical protein J6590_056412 [Homalodisca vitripennis]|nr:hypothetical protein J6590_056412 [Homalodisca vitripennis]
MTEEELNRLQKREAEKAFNPPNKKPEEVKKAVEVLKTVDSPGATAQVMPENSGYDTVQEYMWHYCQPILERKICLLKRAPVRTADVAAHVTPKMQVSCTRDTVQMASVVQMTPTPAAKREVTSPDMKS